MGALCTQPIFHFTPPLIDARPDPSIFDDDPEPKSLSQHEELQRVRERSWCYL